MLRRISACRRASACTTALGCWAGLGDRCTGCKWRWGIGRGERERERTGNHSVTHTKEKQGWGVGEHLPFSNFFIIMCIYWLVNMLIFAHTFKLHEDGVYDVHLEQGEVLAFPATSIRCSDGRLSDIYWSIYGLTLHSMIFYVVSFSLSCSFFLNSNHSIDMSLIRYACIISF